MRGPITFIRDAAAEFEHVVWPTKKETSNYFRVVTIFIIISTLFLFVLSYLFGETLFFFKDQQTGTNVELPIEVSDIQVTPSDSTEVEQAPSENPEATAPAAQ